MVFWVLGIVAGFALLGAGAVQFAIARNGPAVLSAFDRLSGGSAGARQLATISTGDHSAQKLIVWGPENSAADAALPVFVFVHGGSWRTGDPVDYGFLARAIVPEGFIVVLAGYRLMGDGSSGDGRAGAWPAMVEDTARAVSWTHAEIAQYGGDPDRIVIAGHSAGAYNVVMTAMDPRWLAKEERANDTLSPDIISGVIGLSGPYDFHPFDSDSTIAAFGKAKDPIATQIAPHLRGDAPPMLLIHGEKDDLVGLHNSRNLADQIKELGGTAQLKTYPDMAHNDPLISFASPWRDRRDVVDVVTAFAHTVTQD